MWIMIHSNDVHRSECKNSHQSTSTDILSMEYLVVIISSYWAMDICFSFFREISFSSFCPSFFSGLSLSLCGIDELLTLKRERQLIKIICRFVDACIDDHLIILREFMTFFRNSLYVHSMLVVCFWLMWSWPWFF